MRSPPPERACHHALEPAMKSRLSNAAMLAASVATLLLACDSGPSESEYEAVCVKEAEVYT